MKPAGIIGIILIVIGIIALAYRWDHVHQARKGARSRPNPGDCRKTENNSVSTPAGWDLFDRRDRAGHRRQRKNLGRAIRFQIKTDSD